MGALGLHHLTALDASPIELIAIAKELDCNEVSVFGHSAPEYPVFPFVNAANANEFVARARDAGLLVGTVDSFPLFDAPPFEQFVASLELAAKIGAARVTAHIYDLNRLRALDHFAHLCELACQHGLTVALEFMALSPGCDSLEKGMGFVLDSGHKNCGLNIDILHLIRTGASPADIGKIERKCISHVQLCDGLKTMRTDLQFSEALCDRLVPGRGEFPLVEFIAVLPFDLPIEVEVPLKHLVDSGWSGLERARLAVAGARAVIDAARGEKAGRGKHD